MVDETPVRDGCPLISKHGRLLSVCLCCFVRPLGVYLSKFSCSCLCLEKSVDNSETESSQIGSRDYVQEQEFTPSK